MGLKTKLTNHLIYCYQQEQTSILIVSLPISTSSGTPRGNFRHVNVTLATLFIQLTQQLVLKLPCESRNAFLN